MAHKSTTVNDDPSHKKIVMSSLAKPCCIHFPIHHHQHCIIFRFIFLFFFFFSVFHLHLYQTLTQRLPLRNACDRQSAVSLMGTETANEIFIMNANWCYCQRNGIAKKHFEMGLGQTVSIEGGGVWKCGGLTLISRNLPEFSDRDLSMSNYRRTTSLCDGRGGLTFQKLPLYQFP